MKSNSLSKRGAIAANTVLRVDFKLFFEASANLYNKESNPGGAFTLNTAENKQSWPLLKEKLELIHLEKSTPDWTANYTSCLGKDSFRRVLANFLARFLTKCPINPDHLGVSAGATAVVEMTSWLLADHGDVAVFPAPCYPVYKNDIGNKAGVERYDLITHHEVSEIYHQPVLAIAHLEKAKKDIARQGKTFKMLVLTTPDNPTGGIYSQEQLAQIAAWCINNEIHLIVNEIYGLSIINTAHPSIKNDYVKKIPFVSFAQIMQHKNSPYLHLWYALSKDLGISGFRVGLVYSLNETFLEAYDNFNAPHLISNHTQWLLEEVLSDHHFMSNYIQLNQQSLTASYIVVIQHLRALKIPYVPARGSLFIWIDCSQFLTAPTQKAETEFWENFYKNTGVLLTPGEGFGHTKKGLFRIVYPCFSKEELEVAMQRFGSYIKHISG